MILTGTCRISENPADVSKVAPLQEKRRIPLHPPSERPDAFDPDVRIRIAIPVNENPRRNTHQQLTKRETRFP